MRNWFRMWFPLLVAAVMIVGFVGVATAKPPPEKILSLVIVTVCDATYGYVFTTDRGRVLVVDAANAGAVSPELFKTMQDEAKTVYRAGVMDPKFCGARI